MQTQVHNIFKSHITKSSINQSIFEVMRQIWQQNFIRSKIHVNVQRSARYWICEVNIVHAFVFQGLIVTTWLFECLNYGEIVAILNLRVRNKYFLNWKLFIFLVNLICKTRTINLLNIRSSYVWWEWDGSKLQFWKFSFLNVQSKIPTITPNFNYIRSLTDNARTCKSNVRTTSATQIHQDSKFVWFWLHS